MAYTKSISVYCASSTLVGETYVEAAFELGKLMAAWWRTGFDGCCGTRSTQHWR